MAKLQRFNLHIRKEKNIIQNLTPNALLQRYEQILYT